MKETQKKPRILVFGVVLIAVMLLVSIVLENVLTADEDALVWKDAAPLLYESDGMLYMANGDNIMALSGAKVMGAQGDGRLNGVLTADGRWLFYIADFDRDTGSGTLMRVAADALSSPVCVGVDVCDAEVSDDGMHVLIIKDIGDECSNLFYCEMNEDGMAVKVALVADNLSGYCFADNGKRILYISGGSPNTLYSWTPDGGAKRIATSETVFGLGFSPNAQNIYYVTKAADGWALWIKLDEQDAVQIATDTNENASFFSTFGSYFEHLSDNGQMIYSGEAEVVGRPIFAYYDGQTQAHVVQSFVFLPFDDDSYLCAEGDELYYCEPGQKKVCLSEQNCNIPWFGHLTYYQDVNVSPEKRFLMMELCVLGDGIFPETVTLFEQEIGQSKVEICEADTFGYSINIDFTRLAYTYSDALYMTQKTSDGWNEPVLIQDGIQHVEIGLGGIMFDTQGRYFYYALQDAQDELGDDLFRYALDTGTRERLLEDVRRCYLFEDVPYAISLDGVLYRLGNGTERLADGVRSIMRADGGVYAFTDGGVLYCGSDGTVTLSDEATVMRVNSEIVYLPPLREETKNALDALCAAAKRCLATLDAPEESDIDWIALINTALELSNDPDVTDEIDDILLDFFDGFSSFGQSGMIFSPSEDLYPSDMAKKCLTDAIDAYEKYMNAGPEY